MDISIDLATPAVRDAIARAAELRLIGLLFERPRAETRAQADGIAREVGDEALAAIARRMAEVDEATYVSLLGPGGPVSPREVAYKRREDPARVLADVSSFYRAFAWQPRVEDPLDHVAVETGFVGYLWLKEAYALSLGDRGAAEVTVAARTRFAETHLGPLVSGMTARLAGVAAPELLALAEALLARLGVQAPPPEEAVDEEEDDLACGACGSEVSAGPPSS